MQKSIIAIILLAIALIGGIFHINNVDDSEYQ